MGALPARNELQRPITLHLGTSPQIYDELQLLIHNSIRQHCKLRSALVNGGDDPKKQKKALKGCHFCVATPGRIAEFHASNELSLTEVAFLTIDECDTILLNRLKDQVSPMPRTRGWFVAAFASWDVHVEPHQPSVRVLPFHIPIPPPLSHEFIIITHHCRLVFLPSQLLCVAPPVHSPIFSRCHPRVLPLNGPSATHEPLPPSPSALQRSWGG